MGYNIKMKEQLEIFDLEGKSLGLQDRQDFYDAIKKEFASTGKITKKVKTVRILIMNSQGRIYLQKRSNMKKENAGLYDKTVGGHISNTEARTVTVTKECAEELGFPAAVLSPEEFDSSIKNLDLSVIGVLRQVDAQENFLSVRKEQSGEFIQPFISYFYIGYFDGHMRFKDGESSGLETFSLNELEVELQKYPEKFTEDLKYMVKNYRNYLRPLN